MQSSSDIEISNGKIISTASCGIGVVINSSILKLSNVEVSSTNSNGLSITGTSTMDMDSGKITAKIYGINGNSGTINLKGGTILTYSMLYEKEKLQEEMTYKIEYEQKT